MSIFKTKGIIIKVYKQKAGEFLFTVFTQDYGKIICKKKVSKKEKYIDLGYVINFEILTNENSNIHKIKNIKISSEFNRDNKKFCEINSYLVMLGIILNKSPIGVPIPEIVNVIEQINLNYNVDEIKLILARLKIISILGELNENNSDTITQKILKFINANNIKQILKLTGINEDVKNNLNKI